MGNYKPYGHNDFNFVNSYYWNFVSSRDSVVWLSENGSTIAQVSLHNMKTDVVYQVPTGKKLLVIYIALYTDASRTTFLNHTSAVDSGSGAIGIISATHGADMTLKQIYFEVPASKYVTANSTGNNTWKIILGCIETDV